MTDTMLTKAALAACCPNGCICAAMDDAAGCVAGVDFIRIVRAVLTAIRTPDEPMQNAAVSAALEVGGIFVNEADTDVIWCAQIDSILAEEPTP